MHRLDLFKGSMIVFACLVSLVLLFAIGSLFFIPEWSDIRASLASEEIIYSLGMSLMTGIFSTVLVMLAAVPIAYSFSRYSFPGQRVVRTVLYLPIAFPELVLGLCLLLFFGSSFASTFFQAVGLDLVFTKKGIIAAQFFTALPYAVRIIKTVFDSIDPQLELVSRSLGYSQIGTFCSVSLPLAKSGLKAATAIAFARCVGAFGSVLILAGGTRMNTETLTIALYLNMSYGNLDLAITAGMLLVIVAFVGIYAIETMESRSPAIRRTT
ncbi:MAG: ABC transporter permease subunit [Proteobacteria bacterium]|nr:ABC transporter permease subunit [Pseudomonadota bacterium]